MHVCMDCIWGAPLSRVMPLLIRVHPPPPPPTQSLVNPGDEVILISPAFDIYMAQVQMAGGVCKFVPLRLAPDGGQGGGEPGWQLDMEELRAAFSSRTRILLLNTPHNPTGKVFSPEELRDIASIVKEFPACTVVSVRARMGPWRESFRPFHAAHPAT